MSDAEDDAELGTHFLDSILEVEMTEEDREVNISENYIPLTENMQGLPPTPTFDLQSQTISYKDTCKNSSVHRGIFNCPLIISQVPKVLPLVPAAPLLKPCPKLTIISGNIPPSQNSSVNLKTNSTNNFSESDSKRFSRILKSSTVTEKLSVAQFLQNVFKPEYIKGVFAKMDCPDDISIFGKEEREYYKECFKDISNVQYCRLHCTICDKHLGCSTSVEKKLMVHKMLKVITCKQCSQFYGDGNFPCDAKDNCEIYCRWCGQGGALVCCSFCPKVFCKKCVKRNFGSTFLKSIQKASDWACFCCAQKPLWPHRAVCRALVELIGRRKSDLKTSKKDTSTCCQVSILNKRKMKESDRNRDVISLGQVKIVSAPKNPVFPVNLNNNLIVPIASADRRDQSILKKNWLLKSDDDIGSCQGSIDLFKKTNINPNVGNILSSKPIVTNNNVFQKSDIKSTTKKNYQLPPPQLIRGPVLHGETLITPPGSQTLLHQKECQGIAPEKPPFVKISFTNQTSDLDLTKIPAAKIPHNIQELILRLTFPDNKVQFFRLMAEGNEKTNESSEDFQIPEFEGPQNSFMLADNLKDSFSMFKLIYRKLETIVGDLNANPKLTEQSLISSVNKLHLFYEKSLHLIKELDKSLLENFQRRKLKRKTTVADVIRVTDEEEPKKNSKFFQKCMKLLNSEDSDFEILGVKGGKKQISPNFSSIFKDKIFDRPSASDSKSSTRSRLRQIKTDKSKKLNKQSSLAANRKMPLKRKRPKPENNILFKQERNKRNKKSQINFLAIGTQSELKGT